jgi:tetratricopeptide (TPR) repeat protein
MWTSKPLRSLADYLGFVSGPPARITGREQAVYRAPDGRVLRRSDLSVASARSTFEALGAEDVPEAAHRLHQSARRAAAAGQGDRAVELYRAASRVAPLWPYPVYDRAHMHLMLDEPAAALQAYHRVAELAPRGFFTTLVAVDALAREARGERPHGLYAAFLVTERHVAPDMQVRLLWQMVGRTPGFSPAWSKLAEAEAVPARQLGLVDRGLLADPDPQTRGMLQIRRALALHALDRTAEAVEILADLVLDPESPIGPELLAKVALRSILDA